MKIDKRTNHINMIEKIFFLTCIVIILLMLYLLARFFIVREWTNGFCLGVTNYITGRDNMFERMWCYEYCEWVTENSYKCRESIK